MHKLRKRIYVRRSEMWYLFITRLTAQQSPWYTSGRPLASTTTPGNIRSASGDKSLRHTFYRTQNTNENPKDADLLHQLTSAGRVATWWMLVTCQDIAIVCTLKPTQWDVKPKHDLKKMKIKVADPPVGKSCFSSWKNMGFLWRTYRVVASPLWAYIFTIFSSSLFGTSSLRSSADSKGKAVDISPLSFLLYDITKT